MDAQGHLRLMESAMEEWRPVVGYEGLYEVSSEGRVRSLDRVVCDTRGRKTPHTGQVIAPFLATNGYLMVQLSRNGKRTPKTVHRIASVAFHGEPDLGLVVRHLNGDKSDCRVANLAWGTPKENALDKLTHGTQVSGRKLSDDDVRAIRKSGKTVAEIALDYGLSHNYVWHIKTGKARVAA